MDISLKAKQIQSLKLTPKILQGLQVMQYNIGELAQHVKSEISENPFLEEVEKENSDALPLNSEDINWDDQTKYEKEWGDNDFYSTRSQTSTSDIIEKKTASSVSLYEYLIEQLFFTYPIDSREYKIGEYIISSIDKKGFFNEEEIKIGVDYFEKQTGSNENNTKALFLNVLEEIKNFDPKGIATSGIKDFLLYQIKNHEPLNFLAIEILMNDYDLFEKKKYPALVKKYKTNKEKISQTIDCISELEILPIRNYSNQTNDTAYIIPDVLVEVIDKKINVYLNKSTIPNIKINAELESSFKQKENPIPVSLEQKKYFNEKLKSAKELIENINYRTSNLQKIMEKLIVVQKKFFLKGYDFIQPYTLSKLSEETHINIGTISRLVRSKYIETTWGIFSLRKLFDYSIGDDNVATSKVKKLIGKIISQYDGDKKLSDNKIANILNKQGYKIARRTVNKYRQQLQILSSTER